jgi:hypothetical protein
MDIILSTGPTTATERWRMTSQGVIRMANATTPLGVTTTAGYGWQAVSNGEWYVWDDLGNRTLLSAENDKGEMIRKTDKLFGGFTEIYNQTLAGQMMEELCGSANPEEDARIRQKYKGRIYQKIILPDSEIPDWRANEATNEAKSVTAIHLWISASPEEKDILGACPDVKRARPIPEWCAGVQKRLYDTKYVLDEPIKEVLEAEK